MVPPLITMAFARIVPQLTNRELHELLYEVARELRVRHAGPVADVIEQACAALARADATRRAEHVRGLPAPPASSAPAPPSAVND